ncbi:MAG: PAS domain S-box protein [Methanoregula sp.]|jgi:PAS domain S-box-containing protein|nr:PAS domain S-box protein [Methanoregula sp.]
MPLILDPLVIANLLLCLLIILLSIWSYRKADDIAPLYIGAAFSLFGITHFTSLIGFTNALEPAILVIRIIAYLLVIFGLFQTARIILARWNAEQALWENEAKYRALFDAELDAVIVLNKQTGMIQDANASAAAMYGYTPAELRSLHVVDLSNEPEKTKNILLEKQVNVPLRYHKKKDGTVFPVEVNVSTFKLNNEMMMVSTIRDITERIQTLQALLQANRKLNLLSSITRHDINNQLTSLCGNIELSRMKAPDRSLDEIIEREEQAAQAIQQLIAFTRDYQDIGGQTPQWQNLDGIIRRVIALTGTSPVPVIAYVDALEVFSDPMLEKVIFNLVDNSLRHGKRVTEIRFSHRFTDTGVIVTCRDNGVGVPYRDKERIFERGVGKNTGYGLFIAREILGITGLTIHETGTPGEGAQFEIQIPYGQYRILRADGALSA